MKKRVEKHLDVSDHHQHPSKNQFQPVTSVHTTIRSINPSLLLVPTVSTIRHERKETKKPLVTVKRMKKFKIMKYPLNITTHKSYENPILQTSKNTWDDTNSTPNIKTKKQTNIVQSSIKDSRMKSFKVANLDESVNCSTQGSTQVREGRSDRTSFENEHHVPEKNKKKCSRLCVITSVIIGLILLMIITILLAVLLTRPKTKGGIITNKPAILRWNSIGITVAGMTDLFGNGSNLLNLPFGLTFDWSNTLYVADWSNNRVQKYPRDASFGQTVAGQTTGSYNSTSNFLYYPGDVAVDWNGNVYVADTFNNRIQLWTSGSSTGVTIAGTGSIGNSSNTLNRPHGFARDPNSGTLYIADTFNNRVMCYPSGASFGSVVAGGNGGGTSQAQLNTPVGIYFDFASNSLIIANTYANNVIRWTLGRSNWTLIAGDINGVAGNSSTELSIPMDVILDPMGNVYVADRYSHRVQLFSVGETNGITIAGQTGIIGNNSILLNNPFSVALDSQLNLYVADAFNSRVQKFSRY